MMTNLTENKEDKALEAARQSLDQSVDKMPEDLSAALVAARQRALGAHSAAGSDNETSAPSNVFQLRSSFGRNRMLWGGAIAASCAALTLTLVLRQPGGDEFLPVGSGDSFTLDTQDYLLEDAEGSVLLLAEMDETEWDLVQELEFALWLSEFGDEASAADISG
jgi:hypothetical protein